MSYQEKNSIVSLSSTLVIFIIYTVIVLNKYTANIPSEETVRFWAIAILVMVPVQVVIKIFVTIVFNIVNMITTGEMDPGFSDELDKMINLKAVRNSFYGFLIAFFGIMFYMVLGGTVEGMLMGLFGSVIGIGIILEISQIIYYRKGF